MVLRVLCNKEADRTFVAFTSQFILHLYWFM